MTNLRPIPPLLLYPCNLIDYLRLVLVAAAAIFVSVYGLLGWSLAGGLRWGIAGVLFISLMILDVVDGYLARKLGHCTPFGSLFELLIDLLTHTFVWVLSGLSVAPLLMAIEWTAGLLIAANIRQPASHWKFTLTQEGPWLVRLYFQPMRLNLLNVYSNLAHFLFPISLFMLSSETSSATWLSYLTLPGLIVFEVVTLYMIYTFFTLLIREESAGMEP